MIATAGSSNSVTSASAASVSFRLLKESSLPWSWLAAARPAGRAPEAA
jgi:hypothetical protein